MSSRRCLARLSQLIHRPSWVSYKVEFKELIKIAWPITVSSLMLQLILVVSVVFCGHLGKEQLDATALSVTVVNVTGCAIAMGLSTAFDTLLTQAYGSSNKKHVGLLLQRGILILLLSCFPCWAIFVNTGNILLLVGQSPRIAQLGQEFATVFILGLPGYILFNCLSRYLQAQSIVYPSMIIGGIVNLINAGLLALFLFVLKLDVRGASLAVSLSYWIIVACHLLYIRVSRCYQDTWPGFQLSPALRDWGSFLRLALPGMMMICLEWWSFEIMVVLAGYLGVNELAAHAVLYQLATIIFMVPLGLSIAASVRVGNHLGEGSPVEAKTAATAVMISIWVGCTTVAILLLSLKSVLPYVFTQDHDVAVLATSLIPILALFHTMDATQGAASGILRGIGLQRFGAIINIVAYYVIGTPLAVALMLKTYLRVAGAWWAMTCSTLFQSICFLARIVLMDWQTQSQLAIERVGSQDHARLSEDEETACSPPLPVNSSMNLSGSDRGQLTSEKSEEVPQAKDHGHLCPESEPEIFVVFEENTDSESTSHASLIIKRVIALAVMVAILTVGILINVFLSPTLSSCYVVNGTDFNQSVISAEHDDPEVSAFLSRADQKFLNQTYTNCLADDV